MKIVFVFPCLRNFGGFGSMGKHPECVYVNHGLAGMSAVLKMRGHHVSLIDLRDCHDWLDFEAKVKAQNADFYGVYMQTLDYHEANQCNRIIQKLGYKTVVGGPHPSILPEHVLENTSFDYVFAGEGEVTFPDFIENTERYDRLVIGEHPNLDLLPYEDREIFNMPAILKTRHTFYPTPFLSVISGRGCPMNCSFCKPGEDKIFGKFRMRSVNHFIGEIEQLNRKYNYATLMIDDDAFTVKPDYVKEFCDAYEKTCKPFVCQTRADFVVNNEDLVKRMKEVGLWMFIVGFESGNKRILNLLRKGSTVEQNLEAARICHKHGVKIWANYMLGMPTETKAEVMDTIRMLKTIRPFHYSPSFFTPIVGTDLYDYCVKDNLLLSTDPVDLGMRSPTAPKIKGPDYNWLSKVLVVDGVRGEGILDKLRCKLKVYAKRVMNHV